MLRRSLLLLVSLAPLVAAASAPFTDAEVERRMRTGAQLSAFCYLEARINLAVSGDHCRDFSAWTEHEFPLIEQNLEHATAAAAADLQAYLRNRTAITEIANAAQAAQAPLDAPRAPL